MSISMQREFISTVEIDLKLNFPLPIQSLIPRLVTYLHSSYTYLPICLQTFIIEILGTYLV